MIYALLVFLLIVIALQGYSIHKHESLEGSLKEIIHALEEKVKKHERAAGSQQH